MLLGDTEIWPEMGLVLKCFFFVLALLAVRD